MNACFARVLVHTIKRNALEENMSSLLLSMSQSLVGIIKMKTSS